MGNYVFLGNVFRSTLPRALLPVVALMGGANQDLIAQTTSVHLSRSQPTCRSAEAAQNPAEATGVACGAGSGGPGARIPGADEDGDTQLNDEGSPSGASGSSGGSDSNSNGSGDNASGRNGGSSDGSGQDNASGNGDS
ncbi:hypothetical protein J7337_004927 [Fusarium musae]|uniref:Uncharacterized protein n=1 Tax=Fusarium musae TaxID=1042133 RepID=A0A9P8DNV5_9HYPO|nr:hypothetical protein J7337_004927 [Fusarium musae]KAG9504946.1 hypothetical protein J7337_004927 [Fusarium musae]